MTKTYPLTLHALVAGVIVGVLFALIVNPLCGFALLVLFLTVGGTWRRGEAAIFPFVLGYQWVAVNVGYFYYLAVGVFPSTYPPGDIEQTVWLSLWGLLALSVGIRITCGAGTDQEGTDDQVVNVRGLFWLVIAVYAVNYVYIVNTRIFPSIGVILAWVLDFRHVLLLTLWFEIVRRRVGFRYLWASLAWVFVPLLAAYFSDFKIPLFLLLIVQASCWRPWERDAWRFSVRQLATTAVILASIAGVALLWQAGVKYDTRRAYDAETIANDPAARVSLFVSSAADNLPTLLDEPQSVVEGLVERISYVTFFSRVLEYVPKIHPHTNGELLRLATVNAFTPRFLFPEKAELPSDSVYTRQFTGVWVPQEGTSISIGYMAEFYVDWGIRGMFGMVFLYGCYMGLAHRALRRWVRPAVLVNPALITALMSVYQFEHQFIKTFGALNLAVIVTIGMTLLLRAPLVKFLQLAPVDEADDLEEDRAVADAPEPEFQS